MANAAAQRGRLGWDSRLRSARRPRPTAASGELSGDDRALELAAEQLALDPDFARTLAEYLLARRRLRLGRAGWRASFHLSQ
jgi:hypothetical protein